MKILFRVLWMSSLGWLLACGATARANVDTALLGTPAGSIAVPINLSVSEVQQALLKAADGRGWVLVSREGDKIAVRLERSDWSAHITMVYNAREVQYFSNSTRKGKPKLPEGWIKYLKEDATRIMSATSVLKN